MYPITYEADFNPTPNRGTTFFRPLLAIPWFIVAIFWGILFFFTHLFAWLAVIILGRYPQGLYTFNSGVIRFGVRVSAWVYLQTDEWPPFGLADDPGYPIRVNIPRRPRAPEPAQGALPPDPRAADADRLLRGQLHAPLALRVIAWLTIVFRGYLPEGINNALTFINGFYARLYGVHRVPHRRLPADRPRGGAGGAGAPPAPPAAPPAPPPSRRSREQAMTETATAWSKETATPSRVSTTSARATGSARSARASG